MKIEVVSDLAKIKNEWKKLVLQSATATFFQTYDWCKLWLDHFPVADPYILVLYNPELVALAPFLKSKNGLSFWGTGVVLGKELVTDYGDIIARKEEEKDVWQAVLDYCRGQNLSLHFLRESSPSFNFLRGERKVVLEKENVAPFIELPLSWEDYLLGLERKKRQELQRKIRKLEASDNFRVVRAQNFPQDLEDFFRLVRLSSDQKREFLKPQMEDFFQDFAPVFQAKKMLNLHFLEFEGQRTAATLSFVYQNEVLLYNSGFDPGFSFLSPGFLLKAFLIKEAIGARRKRFDFLRGSEHYKYDLGAKDQNLYSVSIKDS